MEAWLAGGLLQTEHDSGHVFWLVGPIMVVLWPCLRSLPTGVRSCSKVAEVTTDHVAVVDVNQFSFWSPDIIHSCQCIKSTRSKILVRYSLQLPFPQSVYSPFRL